MRLRPQREDHNAAVVILATTALALLTLGAFVVYDGVGAWGRAIFAAILVSANVALWWWPKDVSP